MKDEQKQQLEQLIDNNDIDSVLDAMADICHAKAEHVRENWQDKGTAKFWDAQALKIERVPRHD